MSNEEKTNDYENFEKGMIYMNILKKGGVVEKRGEEETKSMPHAPVSHIGDILNVCQKNPQIRKTRTSTVLGFYYNPSSTSGINKHWGTGHEVNL